MIISCLLILSIPQYFIAQNCYPVVFNTGTWKQYTDSVNLLICSQFTCTAPNHSSFFDPVYFIAGLNKSHVMLANICPSAVCPMVTSQKLGKIDAVNTIRMLATLTLLPDLIVKISLQWWLIYFNRTKWIENWFQTGASIRIFLETGEFPTLLLTKQV